MKTDPYQSPCTQLKSNRIQDLNMNLVTLNLIGEKVESSLELTGTGDSFLNITLATETPRATINKWDLLKLSFCKTNYIDK